MPLGAGVDELRWFGIYLPTYHRRDQFDRRRSEHLKKPKRVVLGPKFWRRAVPLSVIAVVGLLIYLEQIALLYVLATLALVALLLIVAFADLESVGEMDEGSDPDAAEGSAAKDASPATARVGQIQNDTP